MRMKVTPLYWKIKKAISDGYRLIILKGGSRSSKTWTLQQIFAEEMLTRRIKITVWRAEKTTCRATVMDDFKDIVFQEDFVDEFKENKTIGMFEGIEENSKIYFEGTDDVKKVHGMKQNWSHFNEVTEINEAVFLQVTQRTSELVFVDYNPSMSFFIDRMMARKDAIVIHSTYLDNPFCPPNIIKQLNSYNPFHPDDDHLPRSERRPHPINVEAGTANEYYYDVYCLGIKAEKPGRIYNGWKTIPYDEYDSIPYPSIYAMDFGMVSPTSVVEIKFDGDNKFFCRQLVYKPMNLMKHELAEELIEKTNIKPSEDIIVVDPNNLEERKKLQQHGFNVYTALKNSGSVISGIKSVQSNIIYFTDKCDDAWDEYQNYTWKYNSKGDILEEPVKINDHIMDALRYGITHILTQ